MVLSSTHSFACLFLLNFFEWVLNVPFTGAHPLLSFHWLHSTCISVVSCWASAHLIETGRHKSYLRRRRRACSIKTQIVLLLFLPLFSLSSFLSTTQASTLNEGIATKGLEVYAMLCYAKMEMGEFLHFPGVSRMCL